MQEWIQIYRHATGVIYADYFDRTVQGVGLVGRCHPCRLQYCKSWTTKMTFEQQMRFMRTILIIYVTLLMSMFIRFI